MDARVVAVLSVEILELLEVLPLRIWLVVDVSVSILHLENFSY